MSEIHVRVNDQVIKFTQSPSIASGGVNEVRVVFDFCEKWDGFVKTALFYLDESEPYYVVLQNDTCTVPWEMTAEKGTFYFSVFGEKGETRRTANIVKYKVGLGLPAGTFPHDPSPEVYDQIMALLGETPDILCPDDFKGTDSEKIQACIDALAGIGGVVTINRQYKLTADIKVNHSTGLEHSLIVFQGVGRDAEICFDAYSFVGGEPPKDANGKTPKPGGLVFTDLMLSGGDGESIGRSVGFRCNNLIQLRFLNCQIKYFGCFLHTSTYLQSVYIESCLIRGIRGTFAKYEYDESAKTEWPNTFFDFKIIGSVCEASNRLIDVNQLYGCAIVNSCIEGFSETPITLGENMCGVEISGNYFEYNGKNTGRCNIDLSNMTGTASLTIANNYFTEPYKDPDTEEIIKCEIINLPIKIGRGTVTISGNCAPWWSKHCTFVSVPDEADSTLDNVIIHSNTGEIKDKNGVLSVVDLRVVPKTLQYAKQTLTTEQKAQARENIGVSSKDEIDSIYAKKEYSKNLFDPNHPDIVDGYGVNPNGQTFTADYLANFFTSQYIEVKENTAYSLSPVMQSSTYIAFYDADKVFISHILYSDNNGSGSENLVSPAKAKYCRFTGRIRDKQATMLEEGSFATKFVRYGEITIADAVLCVAQELTSKQQAQAMENLGVDKLCPPFTESGSVVVCEPVEGYPLEVTAESGATKITRCGKNHFGGDALADAIVSKDDGSGAGVKKNEVNKTVTFDPGKCIRTGHLYNRFKENTQYTVILYGFNTLAEGIANVRVQYTDQTTDNLFFNNGNLGQNCPANEPGYVIYKTTAGKTPWRISLSWSNGTTVLYYDKCGIFEGNVSLEEFEAYKGETFTPGKQIPALAGINTLFADSGNITVKGRANPAAIIEKLTNAIIALGGNV